MYTRPWEIERKRVEMSHCKRIKCKSNQTVQRISNINEETNGLEKRLEVILLLPIRHSNKTAQLSVMSKTNKCFVSSAQYNLNNFLIRIVDIQNVNCVVINKDCWLLWKHGRCCSKKWFSNFSHNAEKTVKFKIFQSEQQYWRNRSRICNCIEAFSTSERWI